MGLLGRSAIWAKGDLITRRKHGWEERRGRFDGITCPNVMVDKSIREEDGSDNEEKDEDIKDVVCQLLDQRTASQRRDKSYTPSH